MSVPEGVYEGRIVAAEVVEGYDEKGIALSFEVLIADGTETVYPTQQVGGEWGHITEQIVKSLDLPWPDGIERIGESVGKSCSIKIKNNKHGRPVAYFQTAKPRKAATKLNITDAIAQLKAKATVEAAHEDDDTIPF